ncbi:hypothetical protein N7462_004727 [Penicillium macrosclerotiorum]|uniref:uncharacterized protein n=1 Tax=Penicillium macrosclerotiorum TaxID=303699 RepID=UPI00254957CD|nr:uncharacterized protein N7462_004727 [Penicillium macrosclerotiorum]KAJ5690335.1 hypothetical protein N7462_004727 [Penicillium macrosclerotiorum]
MPSSRSVYFRHPPAPCVEEETASLAREFHGMINLGQKPGIEGTRARGTVDQYPVIMNLDSPSATSPPSVHHMPGMENASSDESNGPATPPPSVNKPGVSKFQPNADPPASAPPPSSTSSRPRGRPYPPAYPPARREESSRSRSRRQSSVHEDQSQGRPPSPEAYHHSHSISCGHDSVGMDRSRSGDPTYTQSYSSPPSIPRSQSARYNMTSRPISNGLRKDSHSGYLSDSNGTRQRSASHYTPSESAPGQPASEKSDPLPAKKSLADRIEDKLLERRARRESTDVSDTVPDVEKTRTRSRRANSVNPTFSSSAPAPDSYLSVHGPPRAPSRDPPEASQPMSKSRSYSTSISSADTYSNSSRSSRPPVSVKFQDDELHKHGSFQALPSRQTSTTKRPSDAPGPYLMPCPRSTPVEGYNDWYTLEGLTHLDICPACKKQIASSRFGDLLMPSPSKPPNERISCDFGNPWTRLAWTQMMKKKHVSLEMLYQMTRPPPGTLPCPSKAVVEQTWYRIVDPDTDTYVPRFHACESCARSVRVLMPAHRETFVPCPDIKKRICAFATQSPRFIQFIDLLDGAASRADVDPSRRLDLREFISYARRKAVLRDCLRDRCIAAAWHYIPNLPELSVCEDCYDEVIWPLAKANHSIARSFSTSMRPLPGDKPHRCREVSCQLYSSRMRARFRDAVVKDDFAGLRDTALRRFEAEQRFRDRREELLVAEEKGYNCDVELKKAVEEWKRWE